MTPTQGRGNGRGGDGHRYTTWDAAYVLGSLTAADRREFEVHMGRCASCRRAVTELAHLPALLSLLHRDEVAALDADNDSSLALPALPHQLTAALNNNGSRQLDVVGSAQPPETVFPVFRTANYAPVPDELTAFDLPVEGAIPAELNGWLSA